MKVSFDLHRAAVAAKLRKPTVTHAFADAMGREPCGLIGDAENAGQSVAGNALLAGNRLDGSLGATG